MTRKRAPQKPRRSPTTRGRVAVTVLDFACALLVKNTYAYHPKNGILMSFTVAISFDTLCLPVFVNLKQATPNSSKLGLLIQPLTQRAPQRPPTHVFLLSINWHIHCLPIHGSITNLGEFPVDSRCCDNTSVLSRATPTRHSRKHVQSVHACVQIAPLLL